MTVLQAKTCPKCNGSGHDHNGQPIIKKVPFDEAKHTKYVDAELEQKHYHQTIKQGSGCMACLGRGFVSVEVI